MALSKMQTIRQGRNEEDMPRMPIQKPGRSKQDYGTPPEFLQAAKNRLRINDFSVDLAASDSNAVCPNYITEAANSLGDDISWATDGWAWLNPPFGNLRPWVIKAGLEALKGASIAMLVPASTGSMWWLNFAESTAYVLFLNGRLTFVGETAPYPKDCALLLYTPVGFRGYEIWDWRTCIGK